MREIHSPAPHGAASAMGVYRKVETIHYAMPQKFIAISTWLTLALFGFFMAYSLGHFDSKWMLFTIPNMLASITAGNYIVRAYGNEFLPKAIAFAVTLVSYIVLMHTNYALIDYRVTKLLSSETVEVSGRVVSSQEYCQKGECGWAMKYSYWYNGVEYPDEFTSRKGAFQVGQTIPILLSKVHPDVHRRIPVKLEGTKAK
jgi:hypothetical protein